MNRKWQLLFLSLIGALALVIVLAMEETSQRRPLRRRHQPQRPRQLRRPRPPRPLLPLRRRLLRRPRPRPLRWPPDKDEPVARNRTLVLPMGGSVIANNENFNPYALGNQMERFVLSKGFNEMMFYGNLNTGEQFPWQAESWSLASDNKTVTIKIRDGVVWSDGTPFSADDVVFTINEINGGGSSQGNLVNVPFETGAVESITAIDASTVELVQAKPNPRWFWKNFGIAHENHVPMLPKHIWEGKDLENFTFYDPDQGWPVNTGAFDLFSTSPQQIIFDRRDNWWGEETGFWTEAREVERMIFVPSGDNQATTQMLINDEAETSILNVGDFLAAKARNPNLRSWFQDGPIWGPPDGCVFRYTPNSQKEPWSDPDIRRALQYATNRDQIVELAMEGSVNTAVLPFAEYGGVQRYIEHVQDLVDQYNPGEYNPDKTAEIMESKGYAKDSDGYWGERRRTSDIRRQLGRMARPPPASRCAAVEGRRVRRSVEILGRGQRHGVPAFRRMGHLQRGPLRQPDRPVRNPERLPLEVVPT